MKGALPYNSHTHKKSQNDVETLCC